MTWFIVCWMIGAVMSWIGVTVYIKNRSCWTWKGFFEIVKIRMESPLKEALKWLLFMVFWPIETGAVLYSELYARYLMRKLVKSFPILDEKES